MRKILTSVLGVAGLLAVVLALASSPASAATKIVVFTTPATAGEYTINWETAGGCDPGAGTSGASGSISVTVRATSGAASDPPVVNEQTGTAGTGFVTVNNDCTYEWSASLVDAASKAVCEVTVPAIDITVDAASIPITLTALTADGADCAPPGSITVTINATPTADAVTCTQDDLDNDTENCDDATDTLDTVKTDAVYDAVSQGAISKTTFTVTATPVRKSHAACQTVSEESAVENNVNSASLTVIGASAIVDGEDVDTNCSYNVEVVLASGFGTAEKDSNKESGVPGVDDADTADVTENDITLEVVVAQPRVILVQQVDGDSEGGVATYRWSDGLCAAGLPDALQARDRGGINPGATTVELREGRFDITAAVDADGTIDDLFALDATGTSCSVRATVGNLPDHCSAADPTNVSVANLAEDATPDGIVFVGVHITCAQPEPEPEPAPVAPEPDDTGDMGADDMGADDMGADDMGTDDMGTDDMGTDDMGPPEDVATG